MIFRDFFFFQGKTSSSPNKLEIKHFFFITHTIHNLPEFLYSIMTFWTILLNIKTQNWNNTLYAVISFNLSISIFSFPTTLYSRSYHENILKNLSLKVSLIPFFIALIYFLHSPNLNYIVFSINSFRFP